MKIHVAIRVVLFCNLFALLASQADGQASGVHVYHQDVNGQENAELIAAANLLIKSDATLTPGAVREQLRRSSCRLELPSPNHTKLTTREVCEHARASYLRVGWFYVCTHCDQWRLTLGGGYLLTEDGAVGTGYHVIEPPRDLREGCLIAADDAGKLFPVTEILAANRDSDACILRVKGSGFVPLPLGTNVYLGDTVYCLSDPLGRRGYFSEGIVNHFFSLPERRLPYAPGAPLFAPTRINVSADWSYGSSGAAVLDQFGNAIGHVSIISVEGTEPEPTGAAKETNRPTIVFHEATSARDMLELVKTAK